VVEEKVPPRAIKVVDRRRFTTEGEPRDDAPRETESTPDEGQRTNAEATQQAVPGPTPASASEPSTDHEGAPNAAPDSATETSPDFVELIASLAQQAEMLLVGAEGLPAEPDHARRMIDYLVALEAKTAGNVSPEEHQILSNVVFQLRSLYLQSR
jgi:hypothetical protein